MKKKKLTRALPFKPMHWIKKRGKFTYTAVDPVTGGLWSYVAKVARTQDELNADVELVLTEKLKLRPPHRGETKLIVPYRMTLVEIRGLQSMIEAKTKLPPV